MGSYKTAEIYYLKAYDMYHSLQDRARVDDVLTNLAQSYMSEKNYKKFTPNCSRLPTLPLVVTCVLHLGVGCNKLTHLKYVIMT